MVKYEISTLLDACEKDFAERGYIYEKVCGRYAEKTFGQFVNDVRAFATYLLNLDLKNEKIILYGPNSYNYMVADIAVMGFVGCCATVSKEWKTDDLLRTVEITDAKAIIYDESKAEIVSELKVSMPSLVYVPLSVINSMSCVGECPVPRMTDVPAKIIFSSGTTGVPKAVMLTQNNMFACWENLHKRVPFCADDVDYLFLPLSHTYAGICNFLYSLISHARIYLCSDTKLIFQELQEVKPTFFCAVPLIYEKMYEVCVTRNISPCTMLGGNMKYLFCGGAYFKPEIRRYIKSFGINLLESYGLSETSSIISVEYSNDSDFESVGTIFENVDLKIVNPDKDGNGQIYVKGDNVFEGYLNGPTAIFDEGGFFYTGDIGRVEDNKLYLCGRAKNTIILSNGENVDPEAVGMLFDVYEEVTKVKVYEKDKAIFATIYANADFDADAAVKAVNAKLPKFAMIRNYEVIRDSIDSRLK